MTSDFSVRKAALRQAALERRDALDSPIRLAFADKLGHEGAGLFRSLGGCAVALYAPIRNEPDCFPLLGALHAGGHPTLLPTVCGGPGTPLAFRTFRPGDPLVQGPLGKILEPPRAHASAAPDVVIAPGAAFDRAGGRIGFGRGYYDATLAALRANGRVLAIGLAFACQEVERVPHESHDEKLDAVITEREIMIFTENGKALDAVAVHW
jgi:5-formyltetrahydrofolate cyclo-ligase